MLYFSSGDQMARTVFNCCSLVAVSHMMPGTKIVRQVPFLQFVLDLKCIVSAQGCNSLMD